MSTKLYGFPLSHPVRATQLALEHKGVPYDFVELPAGIHPIPVRAFGFERGTVPALKIDGVRVQGSREIAAYLEEHRPEPSLYPADPELRAAVEAAEIWGEETLQAIPRRIFRYLAGSDQSVRRWMAGVVGMPLPGVMAVGFKPVAMILGRQSGADEARVREDVETLPATLDRVDGLIADGVIGGEVPNAADFQILTTINALRNFSDLEAMLSERPSTAAAERLISPPRGQVPTTVIADWAREPAPA